MVALEYVMQGMLAGVVVALGALLVAFMVVVAAAGGEKPLPEAVVVISLWGGPVICVVTALGCLAGLVWAVFRDVGGSRSCSGRGPGPPGPGTSRRGGRAAPLRALP